MEMQGAALVKMSPEDHALDSNEGPIKKYVVANKTKRKRKDKEKWHH